MNRGCRPYRTRLRFHRHYRGHGHPGHQTDVGHRNRELRHQHLELRHRNRDVERRRHQPDDQDHRHRPDDQDHRDEHLEHQHQLVSGRRGVRPDERLKRMGCCQPGEPSGVGCPGWPRTGCFLVEECLRMRPEVQPERPTI